MTEQKRIVVVNDDPTQLRLLGRILERFGYDVRMYLDAAEALVGLAASPKVDLFVVDLHMPGIDGWKLCRLLRSPDFEAFNHTPILVVSATFTGADVEAITADLGANAFLALPFTREELLEYVSDLLAGIQPRTRSKVLVVEDDAGVRRAVKRAFEANGFQVLEASDGAEARRLWETHGADIVLLDYHLPDAKCEELLKRFQSPSDPTVALIMTGDTDPTLPVRLLGQGADGYVRKPFDPAFLVELARKAQRERSLLRVEALLEQRTQELRSSESRFRSLFDAIPDLVMVIDPADRLSQVNDQVARILGRDPEALSALHFLELVPPERAVTTSRSLEVIREAGTGHFETEFLTDDGIRLTVEITAVSTEHQGRSAVLMVARDLTARRKAEDEQRRLEEQVQHAQRLESLGVLAGGIAHDFNNLLVGILGNASLALLDTPPDDSVRDCLNQIETAAKRAAELTQQILTFSGRGKAVMRSVDLSELVGEMGQLLEPAVSKKARLSYRLPHSLSAIEADGSQVRQVVMNLIMNASDALAGNPGAIAVQTSEIQLTRDDLRDYYLGSSAEPGAYVCLQVEDDGCGMDEETLKQIFEPFFTTKFTGRGLGLAATLGIVRAHNGLVDVVSVSGRGTRFRILFPATGSKGEGKKVRPTPTEAPWKDGGTILVVDDEPAVRHLAKSALQRGGFDTVEAADGREALRVLQSDHDVSLVLLDLAMPELDGIQVLRIIREEGTELPVLISSGYTDQSLPDDALGTGHTDFLRKPYTPTELLHTVTELLRGAERRRAEVGGGA
jgi:PAS domain S-box-containing protein